MEAGEAPYEDPVIDGTSSKIALSKDTKNQKTQKTFWKFFVGQIRQLFKFFAPFFEAASLQKQKDEIGSQGFTCMVPPPPQNRFGLKLRKDLQPQAVEFKSFPAIRTNLQLGSSKNAGLAPNCF